MPWMYDKVAAMEVEVAAMEVEVADTAAVVVDTEVAIGAMVEVAVATVMEVRSVHLDFLLTAGAAEVNPICRWWRLWWR